MVAAHARPRPIPAGSRPCADDRARVLRHPYTAMKKPAWTLRMPRAGPTLRRSLNSSMQAAINAVPGRAVPRKKPTPSSISRSPASIARPRPANSSTPPSRPGRLLGLRRDPPGSLAPYSTALVSDEYEPRDSVNSPTAFVLNSGVYPAPFDMVPSSPIELGETRNKKQFIS